MGSEASAALPAGASCLPAPRPACMPRAREPHPQPSLDLLQAREFSSPSYARFLSAVPSSPSLGSDLTKPRVRGAPPPVVSHGSPGRLCSLLPAGRGRPVQPTGLLRSPGPAGGRGQWWSGRGRCGGRGRAPPCGVALACPSSPGGQQAGPGAPAPCHRPRTPREGAGVSGRPWEPAPIPGVWVRAGTHLLQQAGGWEGADNGIGHGWADAVELPDLPPPGPPKPHAVSVHSLACRPAPRGAEGEGPRLPGLPGEGVQGGARGSWPLPSTPSPAQESLGLLGPWTLPPPPPPAAPRRERVTHLKGRWARALVKAHTCWLSSCQEATSSTSTFAQSCRCTRA